MCTLRYWSLHGETRRKKGLAILIDPAEFATRRDSIVCPGKILKASTELSRYRAHSIGSIFRVEYANGMH